MRTLTIFLAAAALVLSSGAASASSGGSGQLEISIAAGGDVLQSELVNIERASLSASSPIAVAFTVALDEPVPATTSALLVCLGLVGIGLAGSRKRLLPNLRTVPGHRESGPTPLRPVLARIRAVALFASRLE